MPADREVNGSALSFSDEAMGSNTNKDVKSESSSDEESDDETHPTSSLPAITAPIMLPAENTVSPLGIENLSSFCS